MIKGTFTNDVHHSNEEAESYVTLFTCYKIFQHQKLESKDQFSLLSQKNAIKSTPNFNLMTFN